MQWQVRMMGQGRLAVQTRVLDDLSGEQEISVSSTEWSWHAFPVRVFDGNQRIAPRLTLREGEVQVDRIFLSAGDWFSPTEHEALDIPAACFFHGGKLDVDTGSVLIEKGRAPQSIMLYGPRLPLEPGRYRVAMHFKTDAPDGVALGSIGLLEPERSPDPWTPVRGGEPAELVIEQSSNLPVTWAFRFAWAGDIEIERFVVTAE
jgi:hypothetical protein